MTIEERLRTGDVDPKYIRKKRGDPFSEYVVTGYSHSGVDPESPGGIRTDIYHTIYRRPLGSKGEFIFHSHKKLEDAKRED